MILLKKKKKEKKILLLQWRHFQNIKGRAEVDLKKKEKKNQNNFRDYSRHTVPHSLVSNIKQKLNKEQRNTHMHTKKKRKKKSEDKLVEQAEMKA